MVCVVFSCSCGLVAVCLCPTRSEARYFIVVFLHNSLSTFGLCFCCVASFCLSRQFHARSFVIIASVSVDHSLVFVSFVVLSSQCAAFLFLCVACVSHNEVFFCSEVILC